MTTDAFPTALSDFDLAAEIRAAKETVAREHEEELRRQRQAQLDALDELQRNAAADAEGRFSIKTSPRDWHPNVWDMNSNTVAALPLTDEVALTHRRFRIDDPPIFHVAYLTTKGRSLVYRGYQEVRIHLAHSLGRAADALMRDRPVECITDLRARIPRGKMDPERFVQ